MNIIKNKFTIFIKYVIIILFSLIALYLFYLAGFSTSVIPLVETVYLIKDSFLVNVLFALLFSFILFAVCFVIKRVGAFSAFIERVNSDKKYYTKCRSALLLAYFIVLCVYVFAVQKEAVHDRLSIFTAAAEWMDGNYSSLRTGYVVSYPHQLGIILFIYIFSHFFGAFNYIAFQVLNAICIACTYKAFAELSDLSGNSNSIGLLITVFCVLFAPVALYTTFVYGTFIGLCLSVNAFKHIYLYYRNGKHAHAVISYVELFLAVVIKSNFLIFAIAYAIICLLLLCKKPSFKSLLPIAISVLIIFSYKPIVNFAVESITNTPVPEGLPTISWVFLGLEENNELFDGWWKRDALLLFAEAGYDSTTAHYIMLERVIDRVRHMLSEPGDAVLFFARKNAAQWNNSDFEAFFVNNIPTSIQNANLFRWLFSAQGAAAISPIFNRMHFVILFGVVLFLFTRDRKSYVSLFYSVTVIGGFIFHTIWEGKSQYTLPYFILLIPMSAVGYVRFIRVIERFPVLQSKQKIKCVSIAALILAFAGIICLTSDSIFFGGIFCLRGNTAHYESYVETLDEPKLENNEYTILSFVDSNVITLNENSNYAQLPVTLSLDKPNTVNAVNISVFNSKYGDGFYIWINCDDGDRVLATDGDAYQNALISAYKFDYSKPLKWELIKADDADTYYLVSTDYALTYNQSASQLELTAFNYDEAQKWVIVPAESD